MVDYCQQITLHKSCKGQYGRVHVRIKRTSDEETNHDSSVIFNFSYISRLLPSSCSVLY